MEAEPPAAEEEDNAIDFDIGGVEEPTLEVPVAAVNDEGTMELEIGGTEEESGGDNVIEFDSATSGTAEGEGLDINLPEEGGEEEGLDFNIGLESCAKMNHLYAFPATQFQESSGLVRKFRKMPRQLLRPEIPLYVDQ